MFKNGKVLFGSVLVCGALLVGCSNDSDVKPVDSDVKVVEEQQEQKQEQPKVIKEDKTIEEKHLTYNDVINDIEWSMVTDEYGDTTVTGLLTNKTNKEIEYIEIEYKFIKDDIVVDSSWINAINIEPNESVKIDIYTFEEFDTMKVKDSEADEWITVRVASQPVEEQPTEQEVTGSIKEVEEDSVIENGVRDGGLLYEDLETTKIKLVEVNENEVKMQYNGTILDYMVDVNKETNGESVDYEITSQLLMTAFCSLGEQEKAFTLVDKEGAIIYSYLNGEPVVNGIEGLQ